MTTPKPLMELCHDALAQGVLAKHDGQLPESWVEMFKASPAAWAQLTQAVVEAPVEFEKDRLIFEASHVHIVVAHKRPNEHIGSTITTGCVKMTALPPWFAELLVAWWNAHSKIRPEYDPRRLGCLGGAKLDFKGPYDVACLYWNVVDLAANEGDVVELCHELTASLIDQFMIDLSHDLHDNFRLMNLRRSRRDQTTLDFSVMSTLERVWLFPEECHRLVSAAIYSQVIEVDDLQEEDTLTRVAYFGIDQKHKEYVPSPMLTLCFTYNNETNPYWTGEAEADEND